MVETNLLTVTLSLSSYLKNKLPDVQIDVEHFFYDTYDDKGEFKPQIGSVYLYDKHFKKLCPALMEDTLSELVCKTLGTAENPEYDNPESPVFFTQNLAEASLYLYFCKLWYGKTWWKDNPKEVLEDFLEKLKKIYG